ncbi:hypothetical protein K2173_002587 [Erythroxylum novogranatense]|uniref:AP2/ERF domain-containing protein n=1 Tax=Erythroxylum novogranatense TaxID=1862640 RepID=A0AAV8TUC9_9ROSI|nr:hypothetical protein K2173_002587 [Erythroxylum novogranatense]
MSNTNWLRWSLSSDMKMEVSSNPNYHHQPESASVAVPTAIPSSFFHSSPHDLSYGLYYGVDGESGCLSSPLPLMPLNSGGSLCIMEELTSSQPQATMETSSTAKREDFFGGATMGTHPCDRGAMGLSLDSVYYNQNPAHGSDSHKFLQRLHHNSMHQIEAQQYSYYMGNEMLLGEDVKKTQVSDCHLRLPTLGDDNGMKNCISRNCRANHAMDQKITGCIRDNGSESRSISAMTYGDLQSLSLSMSPGSQRVSPSLTDCAYKETKKRSPDKVDRKQIVHRKFMKTFGQRTSQYRGVTRHRWTGRYEAHLWDNSCKKEGQTRKGRQVYLGGYAKEEKAARAYDLAALKYWGPSTQINFPLENYQKELEDMKNMSRQEYVAHLRRKSSGFSRGASIYRGVTRHHRHGRWQARIGRVTGNKDLYIGTFRTQEEAAEAYDVAAIKFRGINAVTNFDITRYDVERIMASSTLLARELARRNSAIVSSNDVENHEPPVHSNNGETIPSQKNNESALDWRMILDNSSQPMDHKDSYLVDNYKIQGLSLTTDSIIGIDNMSSVHQQVGEDSAKIRAHLSSASSLVSSLSSSRELGSPDRAAGSLPMLLAVPSSATSNLFSSPTSNVNSWIPSTQLLNVPVFAGWTDA